MAKTKIINKALSIQKDCLFFVFTCVKNGRPFIDRLFRSMLLQTKKNFIHYIYEDGSDEPLGDIVDSYKKAASELEEPYTVIYEKNVKNIGLNMATKHCIEKCSAPYFIWIDCDNWINDVFFEELEKVAKHNKKSIVIRTSCVEIDEKGIENNIFSNRQLKKTVSKKDQSKTFLIGDYGFSFFAVNFSYYKEINPTLKLLNERYMFNDNQVLAHCIFSKKPFSFAAKSISYYLRRDSSESCTSCFNSEIDKHLFIFNCYTILAKNDNSEFAALLPIICKSYVMFRQIMFDMEAGRFDEAKLNLKEKIKFDKKENVPLKFRYPYGSKLLWMVFCNFPFIRKVARTIRRTMGRI